MHENVQTPENRIILMKDLEKSQVSRGLFLFSYADHKTAYYRLCSKINIIVLKSERRNWIWIIVFLRFTPNLFVSGRIKMLP